MTVDVIDTLDTLTEPSAHSRRGVRVAFVSDWCVPRMGGIEMQMVDLALALGRADHRVEIVTTTPGADVECGLRIHRVDGLRAPYFGIAIGGAQFRALRALLERGTFDIVHVHSGIIAPFAYGAALMAESLGIPTVVTFHSVYDYLRGGLRAGAWLAGASRRRIAWTAVSRFVAAETSVALGGVKVEVLPNGVDANEWRPSCDQATRDEFRLVSVMRLHVRKRPYDLFEILRLARRELGSSRDVSLEIVGDGPERRSVERKAQRLGMSNVHVHGALSRREIAALFARADAFVLPSRMEAFGIAALEARCAGLPVVARRGTGVEEFIQHGTNGLLGDSVGELASAVALLARDDQLRRTIARTNLDMPTCFDWATVRRQAVAQYDRAQRLMSVGSP